MKLEEITLRNFRQYYGEQKIEFATSRERNVTVIHGVNGAGKTSLFLALNWCLYGEGTEGLNLINKRAQAEAADGDYVEMSVEVIFKHQGERYIAHREMKVRKEESRWIPYEPVFTLTRIRTDGQSRTVNNPINLLNSILPADARTYFFFDGEKIDDFAKPEAAEEVKDAIYNVLKLEVLERAIRHLGHVAGEYRRELNRMSTGNLRRFVEREGELRKERDDLVKKKETLREENRHLELQLRDIEARLKDLEGAKALQEKRELLEQQLRALEQQYDEGEAKIKSIVTQGAILLADDILEKAKAVLDEKRERGEVPPGIREQFLEDLLERKRCICGRPVEEGSEAYRNLVQLLRKAPPPQLDAVVLDTSGKLIALMTRAEELREQLEERLRQRVELQDRRAALSEQLDDISEQLREGEQEDIRTLETKRYQMHKEREAKIAEMGRIEARMEAIDRELQELKRLQEEEIKKEREFQELSFKKKLAQEAADAAERMYQVIAEETRRRIEAKANEIFKTLIWKESHFRGIQLSEDYRLDIIDRYGTPARLDLSAGERQVLSLSFITAMAYEARAMWGVEAPLVMDTPFGRLSSHHREAITENLPQLADQLILFVTDEELHGRAKENLMPRIGKEYELCFDKETSCTIIREVR